MAKVGGLSHQNYKETMGMKVSGGQKVKAGAMLTREGNQWKPGLNVLGLMHLTAKCAGEVYFTRKRSTRGRVVTCINIRPLEAVEAEKAVKKA